MVQTSIGAPTPQAIVTQNSADYATNIQTLVDEDYNVIVTVGFAIGAATLEAATANPDIHFIGVDQSSASTAGAIRWRARASPTTKRA